MRTVTAVPQSQKIDPAAWAAWRDFLRFHAQVIDELERELVEGADMPLTWYDVLLHLSSAPDGMLRMQELAAAVVLSRSGLTRVVDRLERAGYVERSVCPSDRRGMFAQITKQGRKAFDRAKPIHRDGVARHFASRLSAADAKVVQAVFAGLLTSETDGPGCLSD